MASDYVEEMRKNVQALIAGFSEHIDFVVEVDGNHERRGVVRHFKPLLVQLWDNSVTPLAASGQSGPGGPNKAGSRPPTQQVYADLLDTIGEQAQEAWSILEGENSAPYGLSALLDQLYASVARQCNTAPGDCQRVSRAAAEWVRRARVQLGYETRTVQLVDSTCGQCGGILVVAADASTDVRCVGSDSAQSCGMVYGRMQWLSLALDGS